MSENDISRRSFLTLSVGALGALALAGCATTKSSDQKAEKKKLADLRATKKYKEKNIECGDNFYSPKEATVQAGTIVIWKNVGQSIHDVMYDKGDKSSDDFSSDTLRAGNIHVALFDKPGKYFYHCHFHGGPQRGQWGSITVN